MRMLATIILLLAAATQANAGCYEGVGCTDRETFSRGQLRRLSCENLWYLRNVIYSENGYCFKTDRALQMFDTSGCWVNNEAKLKLNRFERTNIGRVREAEGQKGCSR